jgi:poly-gamma-glutamate capsule biosynthesis protein CapA/YwtB (metallophosphatase superfamily)
LVPVPVERPDRVTRRELLGLAGGLALGFLPACQRARTDAPAAAHRRPASASDEPPITLFLCGDVMTGRGIDQILPHPSDPTLHESLMKSALGYVRLAERVSGPIPRPVPMSYPWGDALAELQRADARIVNLETAVTLSDDREPKGINYRMHPRNVGCLAAAKLDVCSLANNHALDWGLSGLDETLRTLRGVGIAPAGAGSSLASARAPAVIELPGRGRVLVFGMGARSSGIPSAWAATPDRGGVWLLEEISPRAAAGAVAELGRHRRPGDLAVVSIHWGPNWGYEVPRSHRQLARALIDAGFDVVHGHSTHHAIGIEIYRDRPIFYGCGDFLSDYEGIGGKQKFRGDLPLGYFASFERGGALRALELAPFRLRRFRLERASRDDALWLAKMLAREGARFGTNARLRADGRLVVEWRS